MKRPVLARKTWADDLEAALPYTEPRSLALLPGERPVLLMIFTDGEPNGGSKLFEAELTKLVTKKSALPAVDFCLCFLRVAGGSGLPGVETIKSRKSAGTQGNFKVQIMACTDDEDPDWAVWGAQNTGLDF